MAIYSNFDGTLRDSIQIGKGGPLILRDANTQVFSITENDGTTPTILRVAPPTAGDHAVELDTLNSRFGTGAAEIRTNAESDVLYQAISQRNQNNGYPGLDATGRVDPSVLPAISAGEVFVEHNNEGRNALETHRGDQVIIQSIPVWGTNRDYTTGEVIRTLFDDSVDPANPVVEFHVVAVDHRSVAADFATDLLNNPTWWVNTNILPGATLYEIGDEVVHNNTIYICVTSQTYDLSVDTAIKLAADWRIDNTSDSGLFIRSTGPASTDPASTSNDVDWVKVDTGSSVSTFNGRNGAVTPQNGDYTAANITTPVIDDITDTNLQAFLTSLADRRVKKAGDTMSGTLVIDRGSVSAPGLQIASNTKAGIYTSSNNALGISFNDNEIARFESNLVIGTDVSMTNHKITNMAEPVANTDAATKNYVDQKPAITSSIDSPEISSGKDGDYHVTLQRGGNIDLNRTSTWNDVASDGLRYIAINDHSTGTIAVESTNSGATWSDIIMPTALSASDRYAHIVSNGNDKFLAVRKLTDNSSTGSAIVYTTDGGANWSSVSSVNFPATGEFIPSNVSSGSNYVLVGSSGTAVFVSTNNGVNWTQYALPNSETWSAATGRGDNHVIISGLAAGSTQTAYTTNGGVNWAVGGTLPASQHWRSVATSNGTSFVAVGSGVNGSSTNVVAYSNDSGVNWAQATMPVSGIWSSVVSNSSSYVAVCADTNSAARSIDGGETWELVELPETTNWQSIATNGNGYIALDSTANTSEAVARSIDGGLTWEDEVEGGITGLYLKDNNEWLQNQSLSLEVGDSRYVSRTGDRMTGRLVIDNDVDGYSLTTTGGIAAGKIVEALPSVLNNTTVKDGGVFELGSKNDDAVHTSNIHKYRIATNGNNQGLDFKIQQVVRDGATTDRLTITEDSFVVTSPFAVGESVTASNVHVTATGRDNGLSIYGGGNSVSQLLSASEDNAVDFITCIPNVSSINNTSELTSETPVIRMTTSGRIVTSTSVISGTGSITDTAKFKGYVRAGETGLSIDTSTATTNAANVTGIQIASSENAELSDTYSHLRVNENGTTILNVTRDSAFIDKRMGIGGIASDEADLAIHGTQGFTIPTGTTGQRPTNPVPGTTRFNTTDNRAEMFEDGEWKFINTGRYSHHMDVARNEWVDQGDHFTFTITQATHLLGTTLYVRFQEELVSGNYRSTDFDYEVAPDGEITVFCHVDVVGDIPAIRLFIHR